MKMFKVANTKSQKLKEVRAFHNRDSIINHNFFLLCGSSHFVPQFKASLICAAGLRIPQGKWVVGNKSNLTS